MKIKRFIKFFQKAFILLIITASFSSINPVFAQEKPRVTPTPTPKATPQLQVPTEAPLTGMNVTLSPVFMNLTTDPGVPVSSQLKIQNNNQFTEYFTFRLAKFKANETGDKPVLEEVGPQDEFIKWISFSEDQFSVGSNEQKTVKFTISPPKDAALGYYYAIMVQRIKNADVSFGAAVAGAPSFLVILEVRSPNAKRELKLEDFTTSAAVYEYLPVDFSIKFKNTGNLHSVPFGNIFIDWGGDKNISSVELNQTRGNVLPQSSREFRVFWEDGFIVRVPKRDENGKVLIDKNGKTKYETKINFNKITEFRIGKYTAHLVAVYDNGERDVPLEASVSFWVIPWKIILGGVFLLLLILLGLRSTITSIIRGLRRGR